MIDPEKTKASAAATYNAAADSFGKPCFVRRDPIG
jgi:hypothetical protein